MCASLSFTIMVVSAHKTNPSVDSKFQGVFTVEYLIFAVASNAKAFVLHSTEMIERWRGYLHFAYARNNHVPKYPIDQSVSCIQAPSALGPNSVFGHRIHFWASNTEWIVVRVRCKCTESCLRIVGNEKMKDKVNFCFGDNTFVLDAYECKALRVFVCVYEYTFVFDGD